MAEKDTKIRRESKESATAMDSIVILSDINPFVKLKADENFLNFAL